MAVFTDVTSQNRFAAGISRAFDRVINFLISISTAKGQVRKVDALNAKSDAQLAAMGLKREDIVRHVFRGKYYV